jgi:WD40 repeat protein
MAWNATRTAVLVATSKPTAIHSVGVSGGCPGGQASVLASFDGEAQGTIVGLASLSDSTLLVLMAGGSLYRVAPDGNVLRSWGDLRDGQRSVSSFAISPDGHDLVVGESNGLVRSYRLAGGVLTQRWGEHEGSGRVRSVAFVSPGLVGLSKGEGNVYLLDRHSGAVFRQLGGAQGFVVSPAASGTMLVGTEPGYRVAVWDTATGQLMARFAYSYPVNASGYGSAGQRSQLMTSIVSGGDGFLWFGAPLSYAVRWDFAERRWDDVACSRLSVNGSATLAGSRGGPAAGASVDCPN